MLIIIIVYRAYIVICVNGICFVYSQGYAIPLRVRLACLMYVLTAVLPPVVLTCRKAATRPHVIFAF